MDGAAHHQEIRSGTHREGRGLRAALVSPGRARPGGAPGGQGGRGRPTPPTNHPPAGRGPGIQKRAAPPPPGQSPPPPRANPPTPPPPPPPPRRPSLRAAC